MTAQGRRWRLHVGFPERPGGTQTLGVQAGPRVRGAGAEQGVAHRLVGAGARHCHGSPGLWSRLTLSRPGPGEVAGPGTTPAGSDAAHRQDRSSDRAPNPELPALALGGPGPVLGRVAPMRAGPSQSSFLQRQFPGCAEVTECLLVAFPLPSTQL